MDMAMFEHGGNIYSLKGRRRKRVLDFSANINPLGLPEKTKALLVRSIKMVEHYPDPRADSLVEAIVQAWGVKKENVLAGNGSVELLFDVLRILRPKTINIPVPSFSEYERAADLVGSRMRFVRMDEKDDFCFDALKLKPADMLLFGNPNNPTANLIVEHEVGIEKIPAKMIVVDEAFMDFLPQEKSLSWIKKAAKDKRIIVLRTFTKFYSIAGLRLGFMIAHKDIISRVRKIQVPWNCNMLAQLAAVDLLKQKKYVLKTYSIIERERKWLSLELEKIKSFKVFPSCVNFLLVKINDRRFNALRLQKGLLEKGILIRNCSNFRGLNNKFFRVAIRKRTENIKLISALRNIL